MPNLTIRGISDELHRWLKQEAQTHHWSVNREAIALLESIRASKAAAKPRPSAQELLAQASRSSSLPLLDARTPDEISGYDDNGLPGP
jgi:antitoxin VapB